MSRLIFVLVAFASMSLVDGDSNQSEKIKNLFQAELACRENLKSSATWPIYVFCAIPILMSGLQIAVLSILLWYIRKKVVPLFSSFIPYSLVILILDVRSCRTCNREDSYGEIFCVRFLVTFLDHGRCFGYAHASISYAWYYWRPKQEERQGHQK